MNDDDQEDFAGGPVVERPATTAVFARPEIDQQVATAHAFPRSVKAFMQEAASLVTITQDVAESCSYALPRRQYNKETRKTVTKNIVGPSARFAEIIGSCWGNARARTGLLEEGQDFITARGVMMDLQKNWGIEVDVPRRITDSNGKRYGTDMIGVTIGAASSIALRNAILKVVPKALWEPIWQRARDTAMGTTETLSNTRLKALEWFQKKGVSAATIFEHFDIKGVEDITLEHIEVLLGYKTALREGDITAEALFKKEDTASTERKAATSLQDIKDKAAAVKTDPPAQDGNAKDQPPPVSAEQREKEVSTRTPAADLLGDTKSPVGVPSPDELIEKMKKARKVDTLDTHASWISKEAYPDDAVRMRLGEVYEACKAALEGVKK